MIPEPPHHLSARLLLAAATLLFIPGRVGTEPASPPEAQPGAAEKDPSSEEPQSGPLEWLDGYTGKRINGEEPWFYINPGFNINHMQMTVDSKAEQGQGGTVAIMDREPIGITYHLDVVSSGFPITEWMGWSISLTTKSYTLNRQQKLSGGGVASADGGSVFYGEDRGTRLKGQYAYIMPALYFGGEKSHGFKLGIGAGYGSGWMNGTVELSNSISGQLVYTAAENPQLLNTLIAYNITSGLMDPSRLKPEEAYLLATIDDPGHLDLLGQYWSATGMAALSPNRLLPLQRLYPGRTLFELSAIESLGRSNIRRSTASLFAYQVYLDFPSFHNISTRFYVEGPVFSTSNYDFSFQSINIAFYYPIGIGW